MESEVLRDKPGISDAMGERAEDEGRAPCWRWGLKKKQIWGGHQESRRDKKDRDAAGHEQGCQWSEMGWRAGGKTGKVRMERIQSTNTTEYPQGVQCRQGPSTRKGLVNEVRGSDDCLCH